MKGLYIGLGGLADVSCISQLGHNPQCSMHSHQVHSCLSCLAPALADALHALVSTHERFQYLLSEARRSQGDGLSSKDLVSVQGSCNLKDQIQHKAAFIREHMLLPGRPPAFVVGHSIGKYTRVTLKIRYCRIGTHVVIQVYRGCRADEHLAAAI